MSQPETHSRTSAHKNAETLHVDGSRISFCRRGERILILGVAFAAVWTFVAWSLHSLPRDYSPFDEVLRALNLRLSTEWAQWLSWMSTAIFCMVGFITLTEMAHGQLQQRRARTQASRERPGEKSDG